MATSCVLCLLCTPWMPPVEPAVSWVIFHCPAYFLKPTVLKKSSLLQKRLKRLHQQFTLNSSDWTTEKLHQALLWSEIWVVFSTGGIESVSAKHVRCSATQQQTKHFTLIKINYKKLPQASKKCSVWLLDIMNHTYLHQEGSTASLGQFLFTLRRHLQSDWKIKKTPNPSKHNKTTILHIFLIFCSNFLLLIRCLKQTQTKTTVWNIPLL